MGLLGAAPAVGAFLGALFSGWVSTVHRIGRAVVLAVVVWGIAITIFGISSFSVAIALVALAVAGGADVLSAVFRSTIVQLETPDELRGRVTAIHVLAVTSGPRLGDIEAAAVAALIGPQASVVSGGILCLLGVAVGVDRGLLGHRRKFRLAQRSHRASVSRHAETARPFSRGHHGGHRRMVLAPSAGKDGGPGSGATPHSR